MGICWYCLKEITLKQEDVKCDNCGKVVNYPCHNCKEWFSIYNEKIKTKIDQCAVCGFYPCPKCGYCGKDCMRDEWQTEINKILAPEITYSNTPTLQNKINKLLAYIESIKISHDKKTCPKGVPITYAKGRIKTCIARMKGYRVRDNFDLDKFKKRVEEIGDVDLGEILTINQSREDGSYGQEYRDAFNYCICLGKLKLQEVTKIIDGEEVKFIAYRRTENGTCPHLDIKEILFKQCPKCKKIYPLNSPLENCNCYTYKKGKKVGQSPKLKIKLTNKDTCQLNRNQFVKDGETRTRKNNR